MPDRRCKPEYLDETGNAVRANIRMLREQRGMSREQLADRMGQRGWPVGRLVVYRIEAGCRHVSVDDLAFIAKIFRVDPADMLRPMSAPVLAAAR